MGFGFRQADVDAAAQYDLRPDYSSVLWKLHRLLVTAVDVHLGRCVVLLRLRDAVLPLHRLG